MDDWQRFLIAMDKSETSRRAVRYVGQMALGLAEKHICLLHVYPEPPPDFYTTGGQLDRYQMLKDERAGLFLQDAAIILEEMGISGRDISQRICMAEGKTISQMVLDNASKITPQYGIELIDVMFKRVNYIDTVRVKVYDRMISERKRIAAERRAIGEGQKAELLGRVEREFKEITSKAKKEAVEIRGVADAEATKIYATAYNADPEFYAFQKSLESYRRIIGPNTTLMLAPQSDLLRYLQQAEKKP